MKYFIHIDISQTVNVPEAWQEKPVYQSKIQIILKKISRK